MVEHLLAKEKAAGSNPVFRSTLPLWRNSVQVPMPRADRAELRSALQLRHDALGRAPRQVTLLIGERFVAGDPSQVA